ncbi:acetyltransferase [Enterococcus florum]|uniref:Acetyltransferase n=1 Tax=Enterococcus florum TaxID=2480627 RepID=A0A4P5PCY1_9ENTE|nr:GNAT family N-acetyltransferase [Enterococcus florum]GCF95726.1 acetyltransferase [Enterococcus florum]
MTSIYLVLPSIDHEKQASEMKQEFFDHHEPKIDGGNRFDEMDYRAWLDHLALCRTSEIEKTGWVSATTFFAVREADQKIIGLVDLRHHIQHPILQEYGGHIGYAVRPSERRKGYAKQMLELVLQEAKKIGLTKVMVSCLEDNPGSEKTILANQGKLREKKRHSNEKNIHIYWIDLNSIKTNEESRYELL